ncbi:MAG: GNAT family N-acetyltransferase [Lentisphaerae bacterium]|nr:GNAT family N-acetyltransferase [Lentisphaerota bacterium]MCP4102918.1 GNAT family N-acetyltransferase [Lentisphaerota bacterium]
MGDHVNIRVLSTQETKIIAGFAKQEGWNPGLNDAKAFHLADPNGFWGLFYGSKLLGTVISINYDDYFSFIGCLIVDPEFRNGRIGYLLGKHAMDYAGNRNIGLDGVLDKVHSYENFGFKLAYRNRRMQGIKTREWTNTPPPMQCSAITEIPFDEIIDYDLHCFPAPRTAFLSYWLTMHGSHSCAIMDNSILKGFGTIRKCSDGYKIGPLFADNLDVANSILINLISRIKEGENFFLDIPAANDAAERLASKYGMKEVFATARMYTRGEPDIDLDKFFGVTSFELG